MTNDCNSDDDMNLWELFPSTGNEFVNLECERLLVKHCAFAVGAGGFRCVLKTAIHMKGSITYECQVYMCKNNARSLF